jgi:hypothetical protein
MQIASPLDQTLEKISSLLNLISVPWLLGGSVSLILRGLSLATPPRDLDIYIDEQDADVIYQVLAPYEINSPQFSQTNQYSSILSHYEIYGIRIEVVCAFRVHALNCCYKVEASHFAMQFAEYPTIARFASLPLTPLAHELFFNVLRQRSDRYTLIANWMNQHLDLYAPAITYILQHNQWDQTILTKIGTILGKQWD